MGNFLTRLFGAADPPPLPVKPERTRRPLEIGWLLDAGEAQFIWADPKRVRTIERNVNHAKAVSNCPAYLDYESRMFEIACPVDLNFRVERDAQGRWALNNLDGDKSSVRMQHLTRIVSLVPQNEWRHPQRPIIQIVTPYRFIADETAWLTQMPPIQHYATEPWPGLLIGGRLPTHIWPRSMMWAFEWWDLSRPLVLKRGEPWFYVAFESDDPTRPVRLVEADMTPDLQEYVKGMGGVANYVSQTYSLFKTAESRRPATLLKRKVREGKVEDAPQSPEA